VIRVLSSRVQTGSSTLNEPLRISLMVPEIAGGTRIRCSIWYSITVPRISPPVTWSPVLTIAVNSHFFSLSIPGTEIPREIKLPLLSTSFSSGL
jgi:hypothetical protein